MVLIGAIYKMFYLAEGASETANILAKSYLQENLVPITRAKDYGDLYHTDDLESGVIKFEMESPREGYRLEFEFVPDKESKNMTLTVLGCVDNLIKTRKELDLDSPVVSFVTFLDEYEAGIESVS